jgi:sigma-54 dependent transcriptional regulator, acetoin dehydrogenase operon transcriptional activator AcoR
MTQEWHVASPADFDLWHAVRSDACVLFTGDHGTAELLARRLHRLSGWRQGPFIAVDCSMPEAPLETHLLNLLDVENGNAKDGPWPTLAQSGTVFLRDVGRLPRGLQVWLSERLAVLRTGPGEPRQTRRRIISWTPTPLAERLEDGTFDAYLYYRLNVIQFVICPERWEMTSRF